MLEYQQIKFLSPYAIADKGLSIPLPIDVYSQIMLPMYITGSATDMHLVNASGVTLYSESLPVVTTNYTSVAIMSFLRRANALAHIAVGDVFFIKLSIPTGDRFSQPLIRVPKDEFSYLRYRCDLDEFGFPFDIADTYASALLPLRLINPQNSQDNKTYETANGEIVTLYAKYFKEWSGETDFLNETTHDIILTALSCDEVYINERRITKTDNYQIDWDNYDIDCDGVTKLGRATFKVRANITNRNSNF